MAVQHVLVFDNLMPMLVVGMWTGHQQLEVVQGSIPALHINVNVKEAGL